MKIIKIFWKFHTFLALVFLIKNYALEINLLRYIPLGRGLFLFDADFQVNWDKHQDHTPHVYIYLCIFNIAFFEVDFASKRHAEDRKGELNE